MPTALVIGANRGIGLALCRRLAARGEHVIGACRSRSPELDAVAAEVVTEVDVTCRDSLEALHRRLSAHRIDRLWVVAGVLSKESLDGLDEAAFDRMRRQFEVNALGPLRCVQVLADRLAEHARIALITSRMGSVADNGSGGYYGYRMSKAALNAAGRSLAIDLRPRGIAIALLHPGYVRTDMTGGHGDVDAAQAADGLIARIDALTLDHSGAFLHANGTPLPW